VARGIVLACFRLFCVVLAGEGAPQVSHKREFGRLVRDAATDVGCKAAPSKHLSRGRKMKTPANTKTGARLPPGGVTEATSLI